MLAAVFLFACQDAIGKYLFATYSVPYVQAIRYLVNLTVMLVIFIPHSGIFGRPMFIAFTFREREAQILIPPVSARYMHKEEIEKYEESSSTSH